MVIKFDKLDRYETPVMTLCNPGCVYENGKLTNVTGILPYVSDAEGIYNFNTTSELNFRINKIKQEDPVDDEYVNYIYDAVQNRRLLFLDDIGFYMITSVQEGFSDGLTYKDVTASSIDYELSLKAIPYIENGTYKFNELLERITEILPLWHIDYIDEGIANKYRTFEDVDITLSCLTFLLQNVQEAYECLFVFDCVNRLIKVYDPNTYSQNTDILITKEDYIESMQINENAEDLYTAISVFGDNDLTIVAVNPTGQNTIYNFTYYLPWLSPELSDKVSQWAQEINDIQNEYISYNSAYLELSATENIKRQEIGAINAQIKMYQQCRENIQKAKTEADKTKAISNCNKAIKDIRGDDEGAIPTETVEAAISGINSRIETLNTKKRDTISSIESLSRTIGGFRTNISNINNRLSPKKYFNSQEYSELSNYIFEGKYDDEYITVTESMTFDQKLGQMKTLYDRAKAYLEKVSKPKQEFSIDVDNFAINKELQEWTEQLVVGNLINMRMDEYSVVPLFLSTVTINYEDHSLNMTFGNDINKYDPGTIFKEVVDEIIKSDDKKETDEVGKTTDKDKNSEIFNDYDNNKAEGDYSHAQGQGTTAGSSTNVVVAKFFRTNQDWGYPRIISDVVQSNSSSGFYTSIIYSPNEDGTYTRIRRDPDNSEVLITDTSSADFEQTAIYKIWSENTINEELEDFSRVYDMNFSVNHTNSAIRIEGREVDRLFNHYQYIFKAFDDIDIPNNIKQQHMDISHSSAYDTLLPKLLYPLNESRNGFITTSDAINKGDFGLRTFSDYAGFIYSDMLFITSPKYSSAYSSYDHLTIASRNDFQNALYPYKIYDNDLGYYSAYDSQIQDSPIMYNLLGRFRLHSGRNPDNQVISNWIPRADKIGIKCDCDFKQTANENPVMDSSPRGLYIRAVKDDFGNVVAFEPIIVNTNIGSELIDGMYDGLDIQKYHDLNITQINNQKQSNKWTTHPEADDEIAYVNESIGTEMYYYYVYNGNYYKRKVSGTHYAESSGTQVTEEEVVALFGSEARSENTHYLEAVETVVTGTAASAEGYNTTATGDYSHAQNEGTVAEYEANTAIGRYNEENKDLALAIGNGLSESTRSNALEVDWDGNVQISGTFRDKNGEIKSVQISSTIDADSTNDSAAGSKAVYDFVTDRLDSKVDKVYGKELSTNDFTDEYKEAIDNLPIAYAPTDAEKNIIQGIKVNNTLIQPDADRIVNISVSGGGGGVVDMPNIKINGEVKSEIDGVIDLGDYVVQVDGMGLTDNNYSDEDKTKVNSALQGVVFNGADLTVTENKVSISAITQHQSLAGYATEQYVQNALSNIGVDSSKIIGIEFTDVGFNLTYITSNNETETIHFEFVRDDGFITGLYNIETDETITVENLPDDDIEIFDETNILTENDIDAIFDLFETEV